LCGATDTPVNITGFNDFTLEVYDKEGGNQIFAMNVGNSRVSLGSNGLVSYSATKEVTAALDAPFEGVYFMRVKPVSTKVFTFQKGKFKISKR
jgi:hypothetical protein